MNREIYRSGGFVRTRWATAENPDARAGAGGTANRGAKGRPRISIEPGETATLLDVEDSGLVTRIWLTVIERSREVLESVRIRMTWDGATHPAVDIGLGAFFGFPLGRMTAFENEFFSSAEGRSFLCTIPMPFRSSARIELLNTSSEPVPFLFYEVDLLTGVEHPDDALYLHASWNRVAANALGEDFEVLPAVVGAGRFLGCCVGVRTNPAYGDLWWGEGEFKFFRRRRPRVSVVVRHGHRGLHRRRVGTGRLHRTIRRVHGRRQGEGRVGVLPVPRSRSGLLHRAHPGYGAGNRRRPTRQGEGNRRCRRSASRRVLRQPDRTRRRDGPTRTRRPRRPTLSGRLLHVFPAG
jgi:hypothetical protein